MGDSLTKEVRDEMRRDIDLHGMVPIPTNVIAILDAFEETERERDQAIQGVEMMVGNLADGTLHQGHCNVDHSEPIGCDGCSCTTGLVIKALRESTRAMAEALEPFAREAAQWGPAPEGWQISIDGAHAMFTVADLRTASRVLAEHHSRSDAK